MSFGFFPFTLQGQLNLKGHFLVLPMNNVFFELCAETLQAALAAEAGGADRIELCTDLACGGITPGTGLMAATIRSVAIPVHILIRPRGGDFVFSRAEFDLMRQEIEQAKEAGASGVALGVLFADGTVDVERSRKLVELARPMDVTFHRAFDETRDLREALETVIETGADSLLTSGGAADVLSGAAFIAALREQAGERIQIIAGGGLRLENLLEIVRRSGVFSLHGSLSRRNGHRAPAAGAESKLAALEADVRQAVALLHREHREQTAAAPKL
jgi:copper homeostasis protein